MLEVIKVEDVGDHDLVTLGAAHARARFECYSRRHLECPTGGTP